MLTNTKGERKKYLMDNFIKIHPKAISKEICEHLIDFFEKQDKLGHTSIGMSGNKTDLETKDSTDLCVKFSFKTGKLFEDKEHLEILKNFDDVLYKNLEKYVMHYHPMDEGYRKFKKQKPRTSLFHRFDGSTAPKDIRLESKFNGYQIHRYVPPYQGYHAWHADWSSMNEVFSTRMIVAMTYLNDVESGGETEWYHQNLKIEPTQGTMVIWPAYFTHIHKGHPPISNTKYIMNNWAVPVF